MFGFEHDQSRIKFLRYKYGIESKSEQSFPSLFFFKPVFPYRRRVKICCPLFYNKLTISAVKPKLV